MREVTDQAWGQIKANPWKGAQGSKKVILTDDFDRQSVNFENPDIDSETSKNFVQKHRNSMQCLVTVVYEKGSINKLCFKKYNKF